MKHIFLIAIVISCLLPANVIHAANEYATFESFYKEPSVLGIGVWGWVIAGIVTISAAIGIIAVGVGTGGVGAPAAVAAVGTWIGNMMGFSGAVATNAGLALLGGGSLASGGFGMLGGTILLTSVFVFSTEIVVDYGSDAIGNLQSSYDYEQLAEKSKDMPTLPLPVNDSGPDSYVKPINVLKNIKTDEPLWSSYNQEIIDKSIRAAGTKNSVEHLNHEDQARRRSLLALLYFVSNDYINAKKHAEEAIYHAQVSELKSTLPMFIFATSSLYDENVEFYSTTTNYFAKVVLEEPSNPFIPILFSMYLDRISLRINDGTLDEKALYQIFMIMKDTDLEDFKKSNYNILLSRYFAQLKDEQQRISSLSATSNRKIKENVATLARVKDSLIRYGDLLNNSRAVMKEIVFVEGGLGDELKPPMMDLYDLLEAYVDDRVRLTSLVDDLEMYQNSLN